MLPELMLFSFQKKKKNDSAHILNLCDGLFE